MKETLYLLDQALNTLEIEMDHLLMVHNNLLHQNDKNQQFYLKTQKYKEKTLQELKSLQKIIQNEMELNVVKTIFQEKPAINPPLTIEMSDKDE